MIRRGGGVRVGTSHAAAALLTSSVRFVGGESGDRSGRSDAAEVELETDSRAGRSRCEIRRKRRWLRGGPVCLGNGVGESVSMVVCEGEVSQDEAESLEQSMSRKEGGEDLRVEGKGTLRKEGRWEEVGAESLFR